jgi:hypothetical protein
MRKWNFRISSEGNFKGKSYLATLIRFVLDITSIKCLQFFKTTVFQYCSRRQIAADRFYSVNNWMQLSYSNIPLQSANRAPRPSFHKLNEIAPILLKITSLHIIRLADIIAHTRKGENAKMKFSVFLLKGNIKGKNIPTHTNSLRSRHHFNQMPPISQSNRISIL